MNHSINFVDPNTGAHTQNIERTWRTARARIPKYGCREEHMIGHISEYLFRSRFEDHRKRLHNFFILLKDFCNESQ